MLKTFIFILAFLLFPCCFTTAQKTDTLRKNAISAGFSFRPLPGENASYRRNHRHKGRETLLYGIVHNDLLPFTYNSSLKPMLQFGWQNKKGKWHNLGTEFAFQNMSSEVYLGYPSENIYNTIQLYYQYKFTIAQHKNWSIKPFFAPQLFVSYLHHKTKSGGYHMLTSSSGNSKLQLMSEGLQLNLGLTKQVDLLSIDFSANINLAGHARGTREWNHTLTDWNSGVDVVTETSGTDKIDEGFWMGSFIEERALLYSLNIKISFLF